MSEVHVVVHIYVRTYIHASTAKLAKMPFIHIYTYIHIHTNTHTFFQPSLNQYPDDSSIIKVYIHSHIHSDCDWS